MGKDIACLFRESSKFHKSLQEIVLRKQALKNSQAWRDMTRCEQRRGITNTRQPWNCYFWMSRQNLYFYCQTSGFKLFIPHGQSEMCRTEIVMKLWWDQRESACKPARCAGTMQFTDYNLPLHFSSGVFPLQNNLSYLWIWKLRNWGLGIDPWLF